MKKVLVSCLAGIGFLTAGALLTSSKQAELKPTPRTVWSCKVCGRIVVADEKPERCPTCLRYNTFTGTAGN